MARKKCEKKEFAITTCKTKIYKRCPNWKGPTAPKPRKVKTKVKDPDSFYDKEYKKLEHVSPTEKEKEGKWKWQGVDREGRKGPINYTRFPPTNYKKFPHRFHIIEEGSEGR